MSSKPLSNVVELNATQVVELEPKDETPAAKIERSIYRMVNDSTPLVGGVESVAEIMGIDRGDLQRAFRGAGRYLAVEHVMRYGARLLEVSPETAQRIGAAIMRPFDLVVFPRVQLTAAERARRLEALVRSMPLGDQLVAKALETP